MFSTKSGFSQVWSRLTLFAILLGACVPAGGCAMFSDENAPNIANLFIYAGEKKYVELNDAQRAAVDTLREEFPDHNQFPTVKLINWASAENPELFPGGGEENRRDYARGLAAARADVSANTFTVLTQGKISSQTSVGAPSEDFGYMATVYDARRNEVLNGHGAY